VHERHPTRSEGFSIVEMLVAITILMIALLAAALMFENGMRVSGDTRQRVVAAHLATQAMESVRGPAANPAKFTSVIDANLGQTVQTRTVNGLQFTITQDIQWVGQTSSANSCDAGGSTSGLVAQVTESVTWANMRATKPVQSTTALSPPVGAYASNTGGLAVKVVDAQNQPRANINVQITGPSTDTQKTTAQGCAFFAYIPPGTYTASVIEGTGVGDQEQLTPSQTKAVVVGQTASLVFNYDTAATIAVSGWTISGAATTVATNIPISVANTGLQPYAAFSFPATTTSLTPLYPYTSGYTVFAGNCADNNPVGKNGVNNPFYPGQPTTPINVTAGATSPAAVQLYSLPVVVTAAGVPVSGATVTANPPSPSFGSPNNPVCTNGIASGSQPVLGLAASDAAGQSLTAVPLGHWAITATSGTMTGTVNVWVQPTGIFAVTSGGAATGSALSSVAVAIS
jgi:Tfp pilus assembly protein PilV